MRSRAERGDTAPERPQGHGPEVRFVLLGALVSSDRRPDVRRKAMLPAALIATAHLSAVLTLRSVAPVHATEEPASTSETVTFLDVPPPSQAESPRAMVRPRPVVVSEAVKIPAVQDNVTRPDRAAGFQELLAPREASQLPAPDPGGETVDERDYTGRGVVGGVAGGKPPPALPADLAAQLAEEGRTSDVIASARPMQPLEVSEVEQAPRLLNQAEISDRLSAVYPRVFRDAGVEGSVLLQFVVDTDGAIAAGSARVEFSTQSLFSNAALELVKHARFSPGRARIGDALIAVPVLVRVPLKWSILK